MSEQQLRQLKERDVTKCSGSGSCLNVMRTSLAKDTVGQERHECTFRRIYKKGMDGWS